MSDVQSPEARNNEGELIGRRICVIYDCLFPLTLGGAERWYQVLTDQFVASGASVTYVTRRQWTGTAPEWAGVSVVAASGASELYDEEGIRRTGPAVAFGAGTFRWLLRHRRQFDAVVVASFPFFSLLAARLALIGTGTPILVDYFEVWSLKYWKTYAGRWTGTLGSLIQRLCIAVTQWAQVFTQEGARRLRSQGFRGDVEVLAGLLAGDRNGGVVSTSVPEVPMAIFVGRHVKHKGVRLLPEALAAARLWQPTLTLTIVSHGPERVEVEKDVKLLGLSDAVRFTGSVSDEELGRLFSQSSCTVVPSLREGYGLVVAESVASGTPVVVANNPENLATSLVEQGVNGFVVEPSVQGMSKGILAAIDGGAALRRTTLKWSEEHSASKSMDQSAREMVRRVSKIANSSNK